MDNIQYDPERILIGFSEENLKELAKKLKRRIKLSKTDIIQEILSPPKGKADGISKVWQEINRQLRKELETFSKEVIMMFSSEDVSTEELFKVGYMLTLSTNPEIMAKGAELYGQAEKNIELNKEEAVALIAEITAELEARQESETIIEVAEETGDIREALETAAHREARTSEDTLVPGEAEETREETREVAELVEARGAEGIIEAGSRNPYEMIEARDVEEMIEIRANEDTPDMTDTIELKDTAEMSVIGETEEMIAAASEAEVMAETGDAGEMSGVRAAEELTGIRAIKEMIKVRAAEEAMEVRETAETAEAPNGLKMPSEELMTEDPKELQKRIKILENKLRKAISDGLRTKGQLDKLKADMTALKSQWIKDKEETGKYRNRVKELEGEREEKEKEFESLKQKLEQRKTLIPPKLKEQPQRREAPKVKGESSGEIDLASFQGRKALIFAERDNEVDSRLNALGIIPIWAMEIDWNRPRRRMSTCEIVLYKMNDKKLKKLDEIRDIARYWNIPCNELLNI